MHFTGFRGSAEAIAAGDGGGDTVQVPRRVMHRYSCSQPLKRSFRR
jgi:hypothetical protein